MPDIRGVSSSWSVAERTAALPAEAEGAGAGGRCVGAALGTAARSRPELSSAHDAS